MGEVGRGGVERSNSASGWPFWSPSVGHCSTPGNGDTYLRYASPFLARGLMAL